MKLKIYKIIFLFLILVINYSYSQIAPDNKTINSMADLKKKSYLYKNNSKNVNFSGNNYDVKYHRFNWYIDPDTFYIKGSVTTYFTAKADKISEIEFELNSLLVVDSVTQKGIKINFNHGINSNDIIKITLNDSLALNSLDSLTIYYKGVPVNSTGLGSFTQSYHGINKDKPVIWTLSEPYGCKDWWPCKQSLNDKIDSIDIIIKTPKQFRVVANGLLVTEILADPFKIYHWKHKYPIAAYLIAFAVSDYIVFSEFAATGQGQSDIIEIQNYVYPEDTTETINQTEITIPVMQFFCNKFSPYPFKKEKYGHCQIGWDGGMEHQTMTFLGVFNFEIIAHELAHSWFGNMITHSSWPDLWLNEGFATYLTGLCYENIFPDHYYWNIWKQMKINHITSKPDGSVYVTDTINIDKLFDPRLVYNKGAMILHTLRWVMGDADFYNAIHNYLNNNNLTYNFAKFSDFKTHCETASSKDLTYFFDDWYYGEGYPIYDINVIKNSDDSLNIIFNQSQSHNSVSFFKLPVALKFKNQSKDTTLIFNNISNHQTFKTKLSFLPDSIFFDPDNWLIAKANISIINNIDDTFPISSVSIYPNP
ncbi:MAG: M1 family metallopeptidase, partial [Bacteroidales bacterium]|nr:M1 family metallopeptidase [Bacteroidales bacterium]